MQIVKRLAGDIADDYAQVLSASRRLAPIWHKDKAMFDLIVGVCLAAACPLRLRRSLPTEK